MDVPPRLGDVEWPEERHENDHGGRVVYPVFDRFEKRTFRFALAVADGVDGELLVADLTAEAEVSPDEERAVSWSLLQSHMDEDHPAEVHAVFETTDHPFETATAVARTWDARLVVVDEHAPKPLLAPLRGGPPERLADATAHDVASVTHGSHGGDVESVLAPIAGGPHSSLAGVVGGALAAGTGASLELFYVADGETDPESVFAAVRERLPDDVAVTTRTVEQDDPAAAIVEEARDYDVTVIGAPRRSRLQRLVSGSVTDDVADRVPNTVVSTYRSDGPPFGFD